MCSDQGGTITPSEVAAAIETTALTKDYGNGHGIFDLDLRVPQGEVFGLIGANGAGKTTFIRLIMDLIRADRGSALVLGLDSHRDALRIKRAVGYLPGELPQWPGVRASHIIGLLAGLRGGVDPTRLAMLTERLRVDLTQRYSELSHGNKQKVGLIAAFMHDPDLLVLDEPTLGLDPLMQREVRSLILESIDRGASCLLSSHVLAEVELVCDRVGLIRSGRLIRQGSLADLRTIRIHHVQARLGASLSAEAESALRLLPDITDLRTDHAQLQCAVHGSMADLITWLAAHGAQEIDSRELTLEEVFLAEYEPAR